MAPCDTLNEFININVYLAISPPFLFEHSLKWFIDAFVFVWH